MINQLVSYYSGTIPNCPDDFDFNRPAQKTDKEIQDFINRVEQEFCLPIGILKTLHGKRPKKLYGGTSLSDIRAAAVFHILQTVEIPLRKIAPMIGLTNHCGVIQANRAAQKYIDSKDEKFGRYYSVVSAMAV